MLVDYLEFGDTLAPGSADVVLLLHLHQAGAGQAGDEGQWECPNDQHRADIARHLVHTEGGHKTQGFAEEKQETRGQHKAGYGGAQGGQHHEKPVNQLVLAQRAHRAEQDSGKHHHQGGVDADGQRKGEAVGYDLVDSQAGLGVGDAEIPPEEVAQIDDVLLPQRLVQAVLGHHGRLNFGIGQLLRGKGVAGDRFHQKECDRDDKKDGDQCG